MKIAELFAEITLKGGKAAVSEMKGLLTSTIATKSALLSAATELYKLTSIAREFAVSMDKYQVNTGLSAQQLQKLSFQASQAGVSMQELGGAIQRLQQHNANARLGYGWDPIFSRFVGLNPNQDPVTQLNRISAAIRRLQATNPAEAKALASKAGISDSMYYAILRGTTEEMNKELILTNKEQMALVKLNQQWHKFWFYLKQIGAKLQALSAQFQTKVVRIVTRAIQGYYELARRVYDVISSHEKLKKVFIVLAAVITAIFVPWIAALSAIVLILEDIFTYFEGGDSITGDIINWVKQSEKLKTVWETIKSIFELCLKAIKGIKEFFKDPSFDNVIRIVTGKQQDSSSFLGNVGKQALNSLPFGLGSALRIAGNATANVVNYFQSTGNPVEDARIAGAVTRTELQQAAGQTNNLSLGGKSGGMRYSKATP